MQLSKTIAAPDKDHCEFISALFAHSAKNRDLALGRKVLEDKLRLTRGKSNQIFHHWLKAGFVEGDQFGNIWLTSKGLDALQE